MKRSQKKPSAEFVKKKAGAGGQPPKRKGRKRNVSADRFRAALAAGIIILTAAIIFLVGVYLHSTGARDEAAVQSGEAEPEAQIAGEPAPPAHEPIAPAPPERAEPAVSLPEQRPEPIRPAPATLPSRSPGTKGTLVFVIDDAGHNLHELEPFLDFPGALTIAVLPGLPYSAEAARRIRLAGKEVFLHQPMEALGGHEPGPGAIRAGMGGEEIKAIVNRNLDEIWPVAGMNNHEGSRVTMDEQAMETILSVCRERGIVFLDSRTTAETAAPRAARRLGMAIGERDVFLDNVQEVESMRAYVNTGLSRAEQKGTAVMIGHVWSPDLAPLLKKMFPDLIGRDYAFSSASKAIRGTGQ